MSGGKGGSQTSSVQIPAYIQDAAKANLARADEISKIGYTPYYGPDVAAMTPMQQAAMQNTAGAASAFGMATPTGQDIYGMPAPTQFAGGIQGYSSAPMYEQSLAELQARRPAQYDALMAPFLDPVTGAGPSAPFGRPLVAPQMIAPQSMAVGRDDGGDNGMSYGGSQSGIFDTHQGPNPHGSAGYGAGGYSSFSDMFDGGGPGRSGGAYQGGGMISDVGNAVTGGGSSDSGGGDDGGTVMCTAYCEMGYLPKKIWHLDRRYGVKVYRNDPALIEGYHVWGVPLANYIRKQTLGAKVLRAVMWPIVKAWAEEMAHNMKPSEYRPNYFGKLIKFVGEPLSRMCCKLKPRAIEKVA